eukprot:c19159_g1_i1 orf=177-3431(+)
MAPSPASRSTPTSSNGPRTPASVSKHKERHRLAAQSPCLPSPSPLSEHPVEVVGRIRNHEGGSERACVLQVLNQGQMVRVRTDQGYRDFGLDGVSLAEKEDLQTFYKKYVDSRIETVKMGGRCTIMMYGPTGAGKSYTMFGSAKEPGIAYRALEKILGDFTEQPSHDTSLKKVGVNVTILEIYNEEAFDLLATCANSNNGHWTSKPSRVRVEIMGKKAKNAVSISGSDAEKISKEIAKVEKRRVVKSTLCNDRSSRSHCLVMVDVPALGGRLVLVDMAGSENLEQAGLGAELKLQTGKINQGNIALKRVVEAIANGDSHIPFRDSKLTMLLQDSFEDDESKILMVLCASTDPKDMHKTIGTLEYGSKAKCIVRLPASPENRKANLDRVDVAALEAKIQDMDVYISKLEAENLNKDREREEIKERLMHRDRDLVALRKALEQMEQDHREKCNMLHNDDCKVELERKLEECQRIADELIELGKKSLEEKVIEQQREIDGMRCRMEEIEREVQLLLKVNLQPCFKRGVVSEQDDKLKYSFTSSKNAEESKCMEVVTPVNGPPAYTGSHELEIMKSISARDFSEEATFEESSAKRDCPLLCHELPTPQVSQPSDASDNLDVQICSAYMGGSSDSLQQEMYERSGWLPAIPEDSEGEEGITGNRASHQSLQLTIDADHTESLDSSSLVRHDRLDKQSKEIILEVSKDASSQNFINENLSSLERNQSINTGLAHEHGRDNEINCGLTSIASRRSCIENIFMLCGNRRELTVTNTTDSRAGDSMNKAVEEHRHQSRDELNQVVTDSPLACALSGVRLPNTTEEPSRLVLNSPSRVVSASLVTSKDPLPPRWNRFSETSPVHTTPVKQISSENTPPHGRSPLLTSSFSKSQSSKSPRKLSFDGLSPNVKALNGSQQDTDHGVDSCDVFVKWETSKESSGKLIKILSMKRIATLAVLRKELESTVLEAKHDFSFLMLGDPSGAPVKRDNEVNVTVASLPDCHRRHGSKLACLRPHFNHGIICPLSPVDNQINLSSSILAARPTDVSVNHFKSPEGGLTCQILEGSLTSHSADNAKTKQRLSISTSPHLKGLRL